MNVGNSSSDIPKMMDNPTSTEEDGACTEQLRQKYEDLATGGLTKITTTMMNLLVVLSIVGKSLLIQTKYYSK